MKLGRKKKEQKDTARVADYAMLLEPVITEKSANIGGTGQRIVFKVPLQATKADVRSAVERVFKVKVTSVNTCSYMGKVKRSTRSASGIGRRRNFKKAYVTLQEGQSISVVEGL